MIHKTTRSILSVLLAALLLVTSIPLTPAFAGDGEAVSPQSESGEGRALKQAADGTYLIYTAENLKEFAVIVNGTDSTPADSDADARLMNDIDLKDVCGENVGESGQSVSWTPIGNSINQYSGTFDGNGHTISGLYLDSSSANYQGLFGYVGTGGTVKDLSVSGSVSGHLYVGGVVGRNGGNVINCAFTGSVSGDWHVGGVVGQNSGTVEKCYNTGKVTGSNDYRYIGGVVGNNDGNVTNCYNTGAVSGGEDVGGVVGWNDSGIVENCYNIGAVSSGEGVGGGAGVGGVVGGNDSGTVKNCYNIGSVSGGNTVGGVVGLNLGSVKNCYNTGEVSGYWYVGGVVGWNDSGTVKNCYNTGKVSGPDSGFNNAVGGVVGLNSSGDSSASASVTNCYNTGSVSGPDSVSGNSVGGVVGDNSGTVENCYNTGEVSGPDSGGNTVGGVVGDNSSSGNVTGCYFLKTTGVNESLQGIGRDDSATSATAAAVKDLSELCNALKGDTWTISENLNRPVLTSNHEDDGTQAHPYEIFTAIDLKNFRDLVNGANNQTADPDAHAKLMNNIDLSSVCGDSNSWTPIGTSIGKSYEGTFNGDDHTISGLYIDSSDVDYKGLFGRVNGGTVKDLSVSGDINGNRYVGGVVGYNNGGTVTGCAFSGSVSGKISVGGVVGENSGSNGVVGENSGSNGVVENCHNAGKVSGSNTVGGVVGRNNSNGTVTNCTNTGNVSDPDSVNGSADSSNVGGVVGDNRGSVENCYNTGSVSGDWYVGGIVGYNVDFDGYSASVENCYNTGSVSDGTYTGGVVGWNRSSVTNCYFLPTADVNENLSGIGKNEGTSSNVEARTDDAFHSGEVAWLLQAGQTAGEGGVVPLVWGQSDLTTPDSWPTLVALDKNAETVYQVTVDYNYDGAQNKTTYTNNPATPSETPSREGYTFGGWDKTEGEGNTITYTAKWTAEEPPYTGKYSYEVFTSVGDNGAISVDRYATEGEKVTITVTPDEAYLLDDLSVTAGGKEVALTANSDGTFSFTMPSADVKITATFAEDPDWTEPEEPATDVSDLFIDIAPDAWYKDAVQYAYDNGLMTGVSDTEFAPEATTTRAMIVSILARLEGVTTAQAAGFADVDDNEWYATAVNWAASVGVVNGYEDNTFKPNTAITREQLAAILMNYSAYKGQDVSNRADLTSYTDQPSTWAQEAMQWAVAEKLITGVTADTLQPQGAATRAQVAAILQRFLSE